jgi:hypothetical protein
MRNTVLPLQALQMQPELASGFLWNAEEFIHGRRSNQDFVVRAGWTLRSVSEPLRVQDDPEKFDRIFDLTANPGLLNKILRLIIDPQFIPLRGSDVRAPAVFRNDAADCVADLFDAMSQFASVVGADSPAPNPTQEQLEQTLSALESAPMADIATLTARHMTATICLTAAAYIDEAWTQWQIERLWHIGRESIVLLGKSLQIAPERIIEGVFTARDRKMMEQEIDEVASTRAKQLLGFQ